MCVRKKVTLGASWSRSCGLQNAFFLVLMLLYISVYDNMIEYSITNLLGIWCNMVVWFSMLIIHYYYVHLCAIFCSRWLQRSRQNPWRRGLCTSFVGSFCEPFGGQPNTLGKWNDHAGQRCLGETCRNQVLYGSFMNCPSLTFRTSVSWGFAASIMAFAVSGELSVMVGGLSAGQYHWTASNPKKVLARVNQCKPPFWSIL